MSCKGEHISQGNGDELNRFCQPDSLQLPCNAGKTFSSCPFNRIYCQNESLSRFWISLLNGNSLLTLCHSECLCWMTISSWIWNTIDSKLNDLSFFCSLFIFLSASPLVQYPNMSDISLSLSLSLSKSCCIYFARNPITSSRLLIIFLVSVLLLFFLRVKGERERSFLFFPGWWIHQVLDVITEVYQNSVLLRLEREETFRGKTIRVTLIHFLFPNQCSRRWRRSRELKIGPACPIFSLVSSKSFLLLIRVIWESGHSLFGHSDSHVCSLLPLFLVHFQE
jgi:hypothetical protein